MRSYVYFTNWFSGEFISIIPLLPHFPHIPLQPHNPPLFILFHQFTSYNRKISLFQNLLHLVSSFDSKAHSHLGLSGFFYSCNILWKMRSDFYFVSCSHIFTDCINKTRAQSRNLRESLIRNIWGHHKDKMEVTPFTKCEHFLSLNFIIRKIWNNTSVHSECFWSLDKLFYSIVVNDIKIGHNNYFWMHFLYRIFYKIKTYFWSHSIFQRNIVGMRYNFSISNWVWKRKLNFYIFAVFCQSKEYISALFSAWKSANQMSDTFFHLSIG